VIASATSQAAIEALLVASEGRPRQRHFAQVARSYGCSVKTLRRRYQRLIEGQNLPETGTSAQEALDSFDGVDPRAVYQDLPAGNGWWPTWQDLMVIAGSPSLAEAWKVVSDEARQAGRDFPGYEQFTRRLRSCLQPYVYTGITCRQRDAVERLQIYATNKRPGRMHVIEVDTFELPVDVRLPRSDRLVKPYLMVGIDRGTRAVPGWVVLPVRPSSDDFATLLACILTGFPCGDGTVIGGVPKYVLPDNGGEFRGARIDTILGALGIERLKIPPYKGHLKGTVERLGQTLEKTLIDTLPGATHGPVTSRKKQTWRAQPLEFADLVARVDSWFAEYNQQRWHSTLRSTPLQAWKADRTPVTSVTNTALLRSLLPRVHRTTQKQGVRLDRRYYVSTALSPYIGKEVQVGWLPRRIDEVEVFDLAGEWITTAVLADSLTQPEQGQVSAYRRRQGRAVDQLLTASAAGRDQRAAASQPGGDEPELPQTERALDRLVAQDTARAGRATGGIVSDANAAAVLAQLFGEVDQ